MIKRILLDLDDVCNKLTLHCMRYVGCPIYRYEDYPIECGYDILAAVNKTHPTKRDWTVPYFWDQITREVWANTPISAEFAWLLDQCKDIVGRENVCLLTSPTKDAGCLAGKYDWIVTNCPSWLHRQYLVGPRKHFCAHPEALLIDDSDANVKKFRECGGSALLVPRPWNTQHGVRTQEYLEESLDAIRGFDRLLA